MTRHLLPLSLLLAALSCRAPDQPLTTPATPSVTALATCAGAKLLDVPYGTHPLQRIDVYRPATCGPVPVVVWIHGGGWQTGDKAPPYASSHTLAKARGMAYVAVNYRLAPDAIWPAQRDDVLAALALVRTNATAWGLDTARIAVWGTSAGGHLTAWAGVTGGLKVAVSWFAPVNFASEDSGLVANGFEARAELPGSKEAVLLGVPSLAAAPPGWVWSASPLSIPAPAGVTWRVEHGLLDRAIPWQQAGELGSHVGSTPIYHPTLGHGSTSWTQLVPPLFDWLVGVL